MFWTFGVTNAAGALLGALLHGAASTPALKWLLAVLLFSAGLLGVFGYSEGMRFGPVLAWPAGVLSGLLGGLLGNQGGIRSAAMLGLDVERESFVATATAIGLLVDLARIPVYLYSDGAQILKLWSMILWATFGCLLGTLLGTRLLRSVPKHVFRTVIGGVLILAAIMLIIQPSPIRSAR